MRLAPLQDNSLIIDDIVRTYYIIYGLIKTLTLVPWCILISVQWCCT